MKIVFNRQTVLAATAPLMNTTSGKSTFAAAEGIKIDAASPDTCTLTTYDLEKGMRTTIEAKVIEEGSYVLNAQKFNQTMRVMEGEEVTLTVDRDLSAVIESGKSVHKMIALRGEDFPELPRLESSLGFTVRAGILKGMLNKTMYAMAITDQRPNLNGCFVEVSEGELRVVSCDSFKLAKCVLKTNDIENNNQDGSDMHFKFILPTKTVNELYKLLSDEDEKVRIHMMHRHIVFYFENLVFFSLLIVENYIDYDRIIMRQNKIYAIIDREKLLAALERAALITEEHSAGSLRAYVKLQFEGDLLKITTSSAAGSTYDEIEIAHEGADILIAFNNRFLIDSLRACESEKVRFGLFSPLISVNIEPAVDEKQKGEQQSEDLFMILPVRMKE